MKRISARRLAAGTTRLFTCLALVAAIAWVAFALLRVNSLTAGLSYVLVGQPNGGWQNRL